LTKLTLFWHADRGENLSDFHQIDKTTAKIDTFSPAIWRFRQKLWYHVVVAVCNFFANLPILSLWCVGDRVTDSHRRAVSSHQRGLLTGPAWTTGPSHLATPTGSYWRLWTDKYFTFVSESDEPAL